MKRDNSTHEQHFQIAAKTCKNHPRHQARGCAGACHTSTYLYMLLVNSRSRGRLHHTCEHAIGVESRVHTICSDIECRSVRPQRWLATDGAKRTLDRV